MDCQPLHRLSGIQTSSLYIGRIQRQIYVKPDDLEGRVVRHACGSRARDISEFLSSGDALAVHWNTFGNLKGLRSHKGMSESNRANFRQE